MTILISTLTLLLLTLLWATLVAPRRIKLEKVTCTFATLPKELDGFTLLQLSDIHFSKHLSDRQLDRFFSLIKDEKSALVVFTGDFLCYSNSEELERLLQFFNRFKEMNHCFAILGNHDYKRALGVNPKTGDFDILESKPTLIDLFTQKPVTGKIAYRVRGIRPQPDLLEIIARSPLRLLHNETIQIGEINLTGMGEYSAHDCLVEKAYTNYKKGLFGIVLAHNPDAVPLLQNCPSQLILAGHTHGAQINIPFLWRAFTRGFHPEFKRGLYKLGEDKLLYVSRGMWSCLSLRLFSRPEITKITLRKGP